MFGAGALDRMTTAYNDQYEAASAHQLRIKAIAKAVSRES